MNDNSLHLELFVDSNERFAKHLSIPNNERIIFSGKFGHGKTTFLKEFFKGENQKKNFGAENKKYNVISLFPVNYSVASNEDIFRYIKYDIILEMLANGFEVEENTVSYLKTLPDFLQKNAHKVFASIIQMIPNVGKDIIESFERWDKLKEDFFQFHDSKSDGTNGDKQLIDYIEHFEKVEGTVFEDDIVTKLIEKILIEQKVKDGVEENVLIIDDLDRIDPEHIFRILNVFAAHFDRRDITKTKNKFGFDKIIVVCDAENIRQIFSHRYGISTDFNGYIDKFYSHRVFEYNLTDLNNFLRRNLFKTKWEIIEYEKHTEFGGNLSLLRNYQSNIFFYLLELLCVNNKIDLRGILKLAQEIHELKDSVLVVNKSIRISDSPTIFYILLLHKIKGGYIGVKEVLKNIKFEVLENDLFARYANFTLIDWMGLINVEKIVYDKSYTTDVNNKKLDIIMKRTENIYPNIEVSSSGNIHVFSKDDFLSLLNNITDYLYYNRVFN